MASSFTTSQPSPVTQPLPKLNQIFTPDTRVIHRRFFAEHDEAILLEYAKHYNVDNAESLNKSALVRVLTTHNKYIPLLPHHSVTKIAGREIISAADSSNDDEGEGSEGNTDNGTSDSLDGYYSCASEAPPAEEREPANPSWFRGAISSLKGSKQKVFGALMGKKVTKKNSKVLLEEAAAAEYLSDYDSGDEVAAATKAEDHLEASHFSGHVKRPREDEDDGYRQVSDLDDEDDHRKPLSATPSRRTAKRRRMVSSQEVNAFSASIVPGEAIAHPPKATSSGSTVAQPDATSVTNPESSSTVEPEPFPSASTVELTASSTVGLQGTSSPGPHSSSSSYTTPPPSPSHKRSRVVDDEDTEDESDNKSAENARKKARRTINRDASLSALKEAEYPDASYPYVQHRPMTEEEMKKEIARRLKECFIWVPRDEAADEADSDYVPSGRESGGEESEDEEANQDDSFLPRAHIYMKKHAPKAKNVLGNWLEHWAIREDEEDCYKLDWSCPRDPAPVAGDYSEQMATRSTSRGFLLPLKFSPEYFEQLDAYEKAKKLRGPSPEPPAADNYAEFWAKLPPNRRLKRDRERVEENGNIYTPEETPEYKEHRQHLKDTLRGKGASKSFTDVPDSPPPPKEPPRASEYWNPKYIDIWTGKPKKRTPSTAGPSNAGPSKAGSSKAGRSN